MTNMKPLSGTGTVSAYLTPPPETQQIFLKQPLVLHYWCPNVSEYIVAKSDV